MAAKYHDPFYEVRFYHLFNRSINKEIIFQIYHNYTADFSEWNIVLTK